MISYYYFTDKQQNNVHHLNWYVSKLIVYSPKKGIFHKQWLVIFVLNNWINL